MSPKAEKENHGRRRLAIAVVTATMAAAFVSIFASLGTQAAVISILVVGSFAVIVTFVTARASKAEPGPGAARRFTSASALAGVGLAVAGIAILTAFVYVSNRPDSLTLDDAVAVEGQWSRGQEQVADSSFKDALRVQLDCTGDVAVLEFELSPPRSRLTVQVGQANDSISSQAMLAVRATADGKVTTTASISFNQIQKFDLDIQGVRRLRLDFSAQECEAPSSSLTAVVAALTVT
jgi:hypothetical protein